MVFYKQRVFITRCFGRAKQVYYPFTLNINTKNIVICVNTCHLTYYRTQHACERNIMSVSETIKKKLISEFKPQELEVIDESHLHAGHVGARPEGETHFRLVISSTNFIGKSRIDIQREIYKVLKDELNGPVHALTIKTI